MASSAWATKSVSFDKKKAQKAPKAQSFLVFRTEREAQAEHDASTTQTGCRNVVGGEGGLQ